MKYKFDIWRYAFYLIFISCNSIAAYKDPIDTPSHRTENIKNSLLLDVLSFDSKLVAVGERGHIVVYENFQEPTQAKVETSSQLNSVFFTDLSNGWAVGEDQTIVNTIDGGKTWQRQFDGRNALIQGPLLDLYFRNQKEGIAVGVFNLVYKTNDGGKSWLSVSEQFPNPDEWHLFAIASTEREHIYISSEKGLIFNSINGGDSFKKIETGHDGSFHNLIVRTGFDGKDEIIAFGVGGVIYISQDSGVSWSKLETNIQTGLSGGTWLSTGEAILVGADGVVLKINKLLSSKEAMQLEHGLPLSNVMQLNSGTIAVVGLGGLAFYKINDLFPKGSAHEMQ